MKILILNYEHPPIGGGGGRLAAKVGAGLVARGHQVRVLTSGMPHLPVESVEHGMEIRRLRAFRQREDTCSVPEMVFWVARAIPAAVAEVRRWKPDVIHAHFAVPTGAVAWVVSKLTGIPYVLTAHLGDVPGGVPEQTGNLFRWIKPFTVPIWKGAAATTAVSSFVAGLAKKAYEIAPQVILNGMELPVPSPVERHEPPRLLMVGRMSVQKNPLLTVRALGLLKDLPWRCTIIGDGPLLHEAKAEAVRLGLEDHLDFRGWASAAEVSEAMRESDILLIPSLSEGLPMVGVEALAHGLAIVGSRIGGLADVAYDVGEDANARLFELSQGAEGFAAALKPLLLDSVELMNACAASLVMADRFDLKHSLDQYERLLVSEAR
ncbi:MAG: glycosyltransferase family 4 protein [Verrucomicrobia bacterium]|nr:MAG: glycosyltransferase family 4 protein [Verrucomicrobiota bacterium]